MALANRQIITASSLMARCWPAAGFSMGGKTRSKTPTLSSQQSASLATLPPLPVPDLQRTIKRFLDVSKPILSEFDYKKTEKEAKEFAKPGGEGEILQRVIETKANRTENWLAEWWSHAAYLDLRCPLPINLSPGLVIGKLDYKGLEGQIETAAELARIFMMYKDLIDTNQIPPEMAGGKPQDMHQWPHMFGTARIPFHGRDHLQFGCDLAKVYGKKKPKHISVARKGHLFKANVYDDDNNPLSVAQIAAQLRQVIDQAHDRNPHPVGACTSEDRDTWATTYHRLKKNPQNEANLELLDTALFLVCLDDEVPTREGYTDMDEHGSQVLNGGGIDKNSGNRWADKTLQLIVGPKGYAGLNYEHSVAEGPPIAAMLDYTVTQFKAGTARHLQEAMGSYQHPWRLDFGLTEQDKLDVDQAGQKITEAANDIQGIMYEFEEFGKGFPKSQKMSPDSFCQLGFQLAHYRLHGFHPPTYETGSLRSYHLGRTDTIRLPTVATAAWAEAMMSNTSATEKARLLREAVGSHKEYMSAAMTMNAIDRHMLAFRLAAEEEGIAVPEVLNTPGYKRMVHFNVSTSQVPTKNEIGVFFGPATNECYGICYNPQEHRIILSTTSHVSCKETDSYKFRDALFESFKDMRKVLEEATPSKL